ncbi:UDP-N-acetylmuramate dehydrogenase [Nitratiruptor sp. YY08-26]|uniref:UDP-N-acetylmuramate dehydrogenase n=1 Tax=unclassified Nitratiruptor TaxID=2624044 RepID=UPI001916B787|nr:MULTISPECIES: UDP-N-acetylmuramate dehydrogenase [unclassified Nitratiruptor]BCD62993.1 UDP-N-acetylmuramate dehydrogenase [Nitratiruptor sp. YY08-13]BCD66928.1 UDP-N-acetylmuramate dehydrogenase [Nitratiruptor sp. YY08-26]
MKRVIDFSRYSSIKIGPKIEVEVIEKIEATNEAFFLIGGANNLLVSPSPPPLAILGKNFDFIRIEGDELIIGAKTATGKVVAFCKKHDIAGFEFLNKLPGTIGGAVKMNAGVKEYEIKDRLLWIRTHQGKIPAHKVGLEYRKSAIKNIIYEAGFKIVPGFSEELRQKLLQLRSNQPKEPSAGSVFKNPPGEYAGRLIEAVGLKGKRVGNMAFSHIHANFLVNLGGGTFEEAMTLINEAKAQVLAKYGIPLEEEIIVV